MGSGEFKSVSLYAPNTSDPSVIAKIDAFAPSGKFTLTNSTRDLGLLGANLFNPQRTSLSPKEWKRALQNVDVQVIQTKQFSHKFTAYAKQKGKAL